MQYDFNWGENQKWVIRDNGNDSISIYPLSSWMYALNVNENISNGSVLNLNYKQKNFIQKDITKDMHKKELMDGQDLK